MGRGKHKSWSYKFKRENYKKRRLKKNYPKGGYNNVPLKPYAKSKK